MPTQKSADQLLFNGALPGGTALRGFLVLVVVVTTTGNVAGIEPVPAPPNVQIKAPVHAVLTEKVKAGVALRIDADAYRRMESAHRLRLTEFPLEGAETIDLDLEQFSVTSPATRLVIGTAEGDVPIAHPQVALFRGEAVGHPGSSVYLAISPSSSNGFIHLNGRSYVLGPDRTKPAGDGSLHVIHDRLVTAAGVPFAFDCQTQTPPEPPAVIAAEPGVVAGAYPMRVASVAIECDYEYGQSFTSVNAAAVYVIELLGAVSSIYERDLQVRLFLPYIRVWATASDPYSGNDVADLLPQFETYWRSNMTHVDRDIAHFLTSKLANGGLAEVDVLCDDTWGYGSSSGITGSFPVPLVDGSMGNWDLLVVSHEIGHQFGSPHTHCYSPPIDKCWNTEAGCWSGAVVCSQGTIMSYCKACPGDLTNMDLDFGDRVIQRIRQSVDPSCLKTGMSPVYVDWANNSGIEIGSNVFPFNTVLEGVQVVLPGGTIYIDAGDYPEGIIANRPMILRTTGGPVTIGP